MVKQPIISFVIILQMLIGFGITPLLFLHTILGPQAVLFYSLTSTLIISAIGFRLWQKGRYGPRDPELNALGFGLVMAFIMAEFTAVIIVMHP